MLPRSILNQLAVGLNQEAGATTRRGVRCELPSGADLAEQVQLTKPV